MNYMKQVAEMLGVELNETFRIKGSDEKYKITIATYVNGWKYLEGFK